MALDDHIRILSGVRLFAGFTQDQLRLLAFGAEAMTLPAGRKLFREEDDADSAYIVVRGKIKLFREHEGEHVDRRAWRRPGSTLGEMALIADARRMTSAEAATDAEVLRINRSMFRRILEEYPETAEALRDPDHRGSAGADTQDRAGRRATGLDAPCGEAGRRIGGGRSGRPRHCAEHCRVFDHGRFAATLAASGRR